MIKLRVRRRSDSILLHEIDNLRLPFTIGRAPECDLVLDEKTVSRKHVEIRQGEAGLEVINRSSSNGLYVNGKNFPRFSVNGRGEFRISSYLVELEVEIEATVMEPAPTQILAARPSDRTEILPSPAPAALPAGVPRAEEIREDEEAVPAFGGDLPEPLPDLSPGASPASRPSLKDQLLARLRALSESPMGEKLRALAARIRPPRAPKADAPEDAASPPASPLVQKLRAFQAASAPALARIHELVTADDYAYRQTLRWFAGAALFFGLGPWLSENKPLGDTLLFLPISLGILGAIVAFVVVPFALISKRFVQDYHLPQLLRHAAVFAFFFALFYELNKSPSGGQNAAWALLVWVLGALNLGYYLYWACKISMPERLLHNTTFWTAIVGITLLMSGSPFRNRPVSHEPTGFQLATGRIPASRYITQTSDASLKDLQSSLRRSFAKIQAAEEKRRLADQARAQAQAPSQPPAEGR